MKALIISNPFKGTLSSKDIGEIVSSELKLKNIDSSYIPSTDGGDGFFDAFSFIYKDAMKKEVIVRMPNGLDTHKVYYLYNPVNNTSYISISDTCGIKYLKDKDPLNSNTYGFGEAIKYSIINDKPKTIYLGLGGSASIDMGAGMLEALGVKFYDLNNKVINHLSNNKLKEINNIDYKELKALIKGIEFKTLLDVDATIFNNGAVDSYAITKGANTSELEVIKSNAENYVKCVKKLFKYVIDKPGFGAAGGTSFSLFYFLNTILLSGSEEFLNLINIDNLIKEYDLIITGEAIVDKQTFQGKLVKTIMDHSPKRVVVICAVNNSGLMENIYSIVPNIMSKEESINNPELSLRLLIKNIHF